MNEQEFRATLHTEVPCVCGVVLPVPSENWRVGPFQAQPGEWMGVCFVKCLACQTMRAAAAGTSDKAHEAAQAIRSQVMRALGH